MGILEFTQKQNELVQEAMRDIEEVYFMNDLPWVIGYSGGKDSTCTTQIIFDTLVKLKKEGKKLNKHVYVISSDTLVENPMLVGTIHNNIASINGASNLLDLPISAHVIKPTFDNTFWANLIGRGYPCPNQTFRWCTDRMKIAPANQFIMDIVDKYGEAVMVLGVREGESNSRDRVLDNHTIEGRKLMRHTTMANAYVFAPIRRFEIENVWNYLLTHQSPWGANNQELFDMYKDSAEDCPLMIDKETKQSGSCGNSRFGCWVCTVVSKDKSLTAFINKGVNWLKPLLEFRNWLYSIRDNENMRMRRRQDGSIYFSKVNYVDGTIVIPAKGDRKKITISKIKDKWLDDDNVEWVLFDGINCEELAKEYIAKNNVNLSDGSNPHILIKRINDEYAQLGPGPFTQAAREEILYKLLSLQHSIHGNCELIQFEELLEIRKIWLKSGVWDDAVARIYYEVYGNEVELMSDDVTLFNKNDLALLSKVCRDSNIDLDLAKNIFSIEKKYMGFNNRQDVNKQLKKVLSQEFLHLGSQGDLNEN